MKHQRIHSEEARPNFNKSATARQNEPRKINILLVDDDKMICDGFKNLFAKTRDMRVIGIAYDGHGAVEKAKVLQPDVILMDVRMPSMDGIYATAQILKESPQVKILMLSGNPHDIYVKKALDIGAHGYMIKGGYFKELTRAIREVLKDKVYIWKPIQMKAPETGFARFSLKEKEILTFIAKGKETRYITQKLHISISTLHTYKQNMRKKLNVKTDAQMVSLAYQEHYLR